MGTAILIDGAYFLKRYPAVITSPAEQQPARVAKNLFTWALAHLKDKDGRKRDLYRIFYYDCHPLAKKAHHPLTGKAIDFAKTSTFCFRSQLHDELRKLRKVALRFGRLGDFGGWRIRPTPLKRLLRGEITVEDLAESDVYYSARQKGVDMRIGLDIASLAFKRQVDQIVLFAGDSDFVPAAKLARREGIDFILDPMWRAVSSDLHEHIDGLRSTCPRPQHGC